VIIEYQKYKDEPSKPVNIVLDMPLEGKRLVILQDGKDPRSDLSKKTAQMQWERERPPSIYKWFK
jgi:hypothetical protein